MEIDVVNDDDLATQHSLRHKRTAFRQPVRKGATKRLERLRRKIVVAHELEHVALQLINESVPGAAQADSALHDRLKHGLRVGWRVRDDAQNFCRRCLLLQRLRQLLRPCLHLVEQASVLDGNDSLVGERLEEFDLRVGEGADLIAADQNGSNRSTFAHQWCCKRGPMTETSGVVTTLREFGVKLRRKIADLDRAPVDDGSPGYPVPVDAYAFLEPIQDR